MIYRCGGGRTDTARAGFTIVEMLVVIVIIAILATISFVAYTGMQRKAGVSVTQKAVRDAQTALLISESSTGKLPETLPSTYTAPDNVDLLYVRIVGGEYDGLTPVQNGVLFYSICHELIDEPFYTIINGRYGSHSEKAITSCDNNVSHGSLLITSWNSRTWNTPITKEQLESYIASVPSDNYWIDRQDVTRRFHQALIDRFEARGGTWPITSFWDSNNPTSGVPKEELPTLPPTPSGRHDYCIQAVYRQYDISYIITSDQTTPHEGRC